MIASTTCFFTASSSCCAASPDRAVWISCSTAADLFGVLTKPGVSFRSGFYGPAERFLIASGADVQFVPADFRRSLEELRKTGLVALDPADSVVEPITQLLSGESTP